MAKVQSWEVSDDFWAIVEPLIPVRNRDVTRQYTRREGGGRKPIPPRRVFEGIVYVLRTGCQWKALPKERYGSPSAIHRYFRQWLAEGLFLAIWQRGLAEYDEMEGIKWQWLSIDGAMIKSPMGREGVGRNPTDRGKKWHKAPPANGRRWNPAVDSRDRGTSSRREPVGGSA